MAEDRLSALQRELSDAESALEDVRLFRPRRSELAEAEARVTALRAQLARLRGTADEPPATADQPTVLAEVVLPSPTPPPPPGPPAPSDFERFAAALTSAWFAYAERGWVAPEPGRPGTNRISRCLQDFRSLQTPEARRLRAAALSHLGDERGAARAWEELDRAQGARPRPTGLPVPLRTHLPAGGTLVDVRDGLTVAERWLLRALQRVGAGPDGEPKSIQALRERSSGTAISDAELQQAAADLGVALAAPLIEASAGAQGVAHFRLTRLAGLMLPSHSEPEWADSPLPARIPYLLLSGRLGECALRLPFETDAVLREAWHHTVHRPRAFLPRGVRLEMPLGQRLELATPHGAVTLWPTVEVEAGRVEQRAQVVVNALPPGVTWSAAVERLAELCEARALVGTPGPRLERSSTGLRIVVDLEHVIFAADVQEKAQAGLRCVYEIHQRGLLGERVVDLTPSLALEHFLRYRLDQEASANSGELRRLEARLELLEGTLLAVELGQVLTDLLRAADASGDASLSGWALEHLPDCRTHPALTAFTELPRQWRAAVEAVRERLAKLGDGFPERSTYAGGFSRAQAAALRSGRAVHQEARAILDEVVRLRLAWVMERNDCVEEVVRRKVAADLDEIRVSLWTAPR
ncbi:MAG: hypothetical protein AB1938_12155 [Myxococcota bacterium]